jgi:serine/threonine-protein kinase
VCPKDATPLEDAPASDDPLLGSTIAESYEIVRVLGEGAMGKVYEAKHTRLPKRYAVKMLHADLAREPAVVARFQREAEAASALEHPNVVNVFDVSVTEDGRPFIVQELLTGGSAVPGRTGRLAPGQTANIVRQSRGARHRPCTASSIATCQRTSLLGDLSAPVSVLTSDSGAEEASLPRPESDGTPAYMAQSSTRRQTPCRHRHGRDLSLPHGSKAI